MVMMCKAREMQQGICVSLWYSIGDGRVGILHVWLQYIMSYGAAYGPM